MSTPIGIFRGEMAQPILGGQVKGTDRKPTSSLSRVLVIDDDPHVAEIVAAGLRDVQVVLDFAYDSVGGLEAARQRRPDLILLDLGLPDTDGFKILNHLKKDQSLGNVPVIVLTAWNNTADKVKGFDLGAVDYITKPFELAEFRARVRSTLHNKYLQDQLAEANEQLEAARHTAEAATQSKSEFLANMSHEIRTPMNGVIAMTSLLLESQLREDQREFVETIRTSGEVLLTLIDGILDFSKIESGKMEIENEPLDLRRCIEETLDLLAPQAAAKKLELTYEVEKEIPGTLLGDNNRLRQILVNLIGNAIKFTEMGEVCVEVKRAADSPANTRTPGTAPRNGDSDRMCLHFTVRDSGIGIPEEKMKRLFQSFSQVDASTAREYGGSGLGLAISKRLVELMGGLIWAESSPRVGSRFHFTLPIQPAPGSGPPISQGRQPRLFGLNLLIVDDNATARRILSSYARGWGMEVHAMETGPKAISCLLKGTTVDFAILDMDMPEVDGISLMREIRTMRGYNKLPVVILTSVSARAETSPIASSGFVQYLNKPVKPKVLMEALIQAVCGLSERVSNPLVVPSILETSLASRLPLRILLTDDNQINQRVALQLLQQMGYKADIANNGMEAIQAVEKQHYDLILMDVQMPQIDGLEATRRIRQFLKQPSHNSDRTGRTIIIAMTASAMSGDREKCFAAGMDEYLPKPIRLSTMKTAIERWGHCANEALDSPALVAGEVRLGSSERAPVDLQRFRELAGGDEQAIRDLAAIYVNQTAQQLKQLQSAVEAGDTKQVRYLAHSCAGASATCGMTSIAEPLCKLEKMGFEESLHTAPEPLALIQKEFHRIRAFLAEAGLHQES